MQDRRPHKKGKTMSEGGDMATGTQRIFVSHASRDNLLCYPVAIALDNLGQEVSYLNHGAESSFVPSTGRVFGTILWPVMAETITRDVQRDLQAILFPALDLCTVLVVMCSHAALTSQWVRQEIEHFQAKLDGSRRLTISVRIAPSPSPNFGYDAQIDGMGMSEYDLAQEINSLIG